VAFPELARVVSGMQACASCHASFEATRFQPPLKVANVKQVAEAGPGAAATACAAHPANQAAANCGRCGVFMCGLCRIDADELALCPGCFDRLSSEGALASTRTTFRDYGRMASTMALVGFPFMAFGAAIGPATIYYGVRSLRQLREMGETSGRARAVIAILAGTAEAAVGVFVIWSAVKGS
jgi:hypothetical protein